MYVTDGITAMEFSISSRYLAVTGDKHVSVFHNVVGYRSTISELEERKKSATNSAMRERLQAQIDEARSVIIIISSSSCSCSCCCFCSNSSSSSGRNWQRTPRCVNDDRQIDEGRSVIIIISSSSSCSCCCCCCCSSSQSSIII